MAYKEIVTKAVISKGKKTYKNTYELTVSEKPTTILGVWIINHNFKASDIGDKIRIDGSFDANIWYSYDNDTKTMVASEKISYTEEEKMNIESENAVNKDIIIRSLKQPTCISAKENGNTISLAIEKELGIEIVGDTKVKISTVNDEEDTWEDLSANENIDASASQINPNYIDEETLK